MSRLTLKNSAGYDLVDMNGAWCDDYCKEQPIETCTSCAIYKAIQKLAEYEDKEESANNGWITCSERLPEEPFGCLVTIMDCEPMTGSDFENILPYLVGYDGTNWNDANGCTIPFEVLAWQPLPQPYKEMNSNEV